MDNYAELSPMLSELSNTPQLNFLGSMNYDLITETSPDLL